MLQSTKIKDFEIQREIEFRKYSKYPKSHGRIPVSDKKITGKFKSIRTKEDLKEFIQARSAHVTQTTLYGYLKTRMGHKFTLMVDDEIFAKSINLAKWNIYMVALADCSFYVFLT